VSAAAERALGIALRGAALLLLASIQASWLLQPIPLSLKIAHGLFLIVGFVSPPAALLVLAAVAPITTTISMSVLSAYAGARLLEQLVLACMTAAVVRGRVSKGTVASAGTIFAVCAAASAAAILPARVLKWLPQASFREHLGNFWRWSYPAGPPPWEPLFSAAVVALGIGLAWIVESETRRTPRFAVRMLIASVAGHTAAAIINIRHAIAMLPASGWIGAAAALVRMRATVQYDFNAAGPVYAMVAVAAVGLLSVPRAYRLLVAAALALILASMWLTGSRIAVAAVAVVLFAMLMARMRAADLQARRLIAVSAAALTICAGAIIVWYPAQRNYPVGLSIASRRILFKTAFDMARSAPWFGVGIGTFYEHSSEFGATALTRFPMLEWAQRENAHNNFLQVLAEQGIVGLVALVYLLWCVLVDAVRSEAADHQPLRMWMLAGVGTFLLTWLTGHPLLVVEAALTFWLYLGLLAGSTADRGRARHDRRRVITAIAVSLLLVSVPFRAEAERRRADLTDVGDGVSLVWRTDAYGVEYRRAAPLFAVYLPTDTAVLLPMRRSSDALDPLWIQMRVGSRLIAERSVSGDGWTDVEIRLPQSRRRFERLDMRVSASIHDRAVPELPLLVGHARQR
jgi:O-antigen ligase